MDGVKDTSLLGSKEEFRSATGLYAYGSCYVLVQPNLLFYNNQVYFSSLVSCHPATQYATYIAVSLFPLVVYQNDAKGLYSAETTSVIIGSCYINFLLH